MNVKGSLKRSTVRGKHTIRSAVEKLRQQPFYIGTRHSNLSPVTAKLPLSSLGLFGSHELQIIPQLQSRLMKLRLAVTNRASHNFGNLVMFESFYIMQHKNRSIARWQLINSAL